MARNRSSSQPPERKRKREDRDPPALPDMDDDRDHLPHTTPPSTAPIASNLTGSMDTSQSPGTLPAFLKARFIFLHEYANFPHISLANIIGLNVRSTYSFVDRARSSKPKMLTQREEEDIARVKETIHQLAARFSRSRTLPAGFRGNARRESLLFPRSQESTANLRRLIWHIDQARQSICVAMYVITNQSIVKALIAARKRIDRFNPGASEPSIRVILDHQMLKSPGSQVYTLLKVGIEVRVEHGSVNWTDHALVSQGHCFIEYDQELHDLLLLDFNSMWYSTSREYQVVTESFLERLHPPMCSVCQENLKEQEKKAGEAAREEKRAKADAEREEKRAKTEAERTAKEQAKVRARAQAATQRAVAKAQATSARASSCGVASRSSGTSATISPYDASCDAVQRYFQPDFPFARASQTRVETLLPASSVFVNSSRFAGPEMSLPFARVSQTRPRSLQFALKDLSSVDTRYLLQSLADLPHDITRLNAVSNTSSSSESRTQVESKVFGWRNSFLNPSRDSASTQERSNLVIWKACKTFESTDMRPLAQKVWNSPKTLSQQPHSKIRFWELLYSVSDSVRVVKRIDSLYGRQERETIWLECFLDRGDHFCIGRKQLTRFRDYQLTEESPSPAAAAAIDECECEGFLFRPHLTKLSQTSIASRELSGETLVRNLLDDLPRFTLQWEEAIVHDLLPHVKF